jgi:hypothetical protein
MVKTALLAGAAGLLLSACGTHVGSAPTSSPGLDFNAVVTEHDTAITIEVGQKLEVVLHAKSGMTNWNNVRSSDTSVLAPIVDPAATAVRGVTLAAFQALAAGRAVVTASAGALCSPSQACPMLAILYSATVTVI